jgi:hypothetical protein
MLVFISFRRIKYISCLHFFSIKHIFVVFISFRRIKYNLIVYVFLERNLLSAFLL